MKNILLLFATATTLIACTTNAGTKTVVSNDNYVVILDLSDRIIKKNDQVNIDTNAIRAVFEKFEKSIQRNFIVKSRDRFSLRIIPQKGSSLPGNSFENNLSIDMGKYLASEKLLKLNQFKNSFSSQLGLLYQQALLGNKASDFAGVDIWQYFNEQVNTDLDPGYNNKVMILTDGYFDFEDEGHGIKNQMQSTTTAPLLAAMNGVQWKQDATKKHLGIIPVNITVPAKWLVCGIQAKINSTDLLEAQKLGYLWKQWLEESGATNIPEPIINSSSQKIKSLILNNF